MDFITYRLTVQNWSEDYYKYQRSLYALAEAEGNPLRKPVTIFSNFSNAIGIFIMGSTSSVEFDIE